MSRSSKKGPYVDPKLLKKISRLDKEGKRDVIKTWSRNSDISPEMVGHQIAIHDGRNFKEILVSEAMVGHKLGEFAPTRKFIAHSRKGYVKPVTTSE
ncbi:30S ribosomal protein S19 [Patescibacteria group bacterium]|nr:30S ribosomal protein S19 [Patescibacteria group bacterium]MBU1867882.1 30S ribosomal protein S19 [Patescibacteria group bacterium]